MPMNIVFHFDKYSFHLQHKAYNTFYGQRYNIYEPLLENFNVSYSEIVEDESTFTAFAFMRRSTIKSFFASQRVDIPICFKKSKSHYSPTFEVPLIKTLNILMRSGLRGKILKALTLSFSTVFHKMSSILTPDDHLHWRLLHYFIECFFIGTDAKFSNFRLDAKEMGIPDEEVRRDGGLSIWSDHRLDDEHLKFNRNSTIQHLLFESLQEYAPVFSFYIRKVDKSVRKNSRGKAKKYTVIWKYVPAYKRLYVTIRWLLKDLRFQKLRYLEPRLVKILEVFLLSPDLSFLSRVRRFVHNFVFNNFKKTLLKHLKSVS